LAQAGQAHVALGYKSWTAYLADTLGHEPLRLPRDQRQELVGYLAGEGMSTRAIAPIVGVTQQQVSRDVATTRLTPDVSVEPPPATVVSLDGRQRPASRPAAVVASQAPDRAPQRRALTDQFFNAVYDLTKAVERVQRLAADDRFPQNAEKVASKHRNDLLRAIDVCQDVVNQLPRVES
jgi:predicted transcriptional regulator